MTSKIKVDNINKVSDDSNIIKKCGSTITLGASGDSIALASGASQTGFGRTGTVDWDTTAKTASFTAVSGNGYFVNTTSGAVTVTLPASPSAGDIVAIKDYAGTFTSNNCTVARNGSNIRGATNDVEFSLDNSGATFIYVDATEGWQYWIDGSDSDLQTPFVIATGGTITTCGNFKIHTFTGPGTFTICKIACCSANNEVSHVVVAGGGGGGACGGSGGGAGGFRESKSPVDTYTASPKEGGTSVTVTAQAYPITVGGGGTGATSPARGGNGVNSVFSTITSTAGGGGGRYQPTHPAPAPDRGHPGGSGGGSGGSGPSATNAGGSGNTPPVSPSQGTDGGSGVHFGGSSMASGGGGGATTAGANGAGNSPGPGSGIGGTGGTGATTCITGSPVAYAGGGGGAGFGSPGGSAGSPCGTGGTGGANNSTATAAGTTNRGGGGGGGAHSGGGPNCGSNGGSGIVIIRYRFQ